LPLHLALYPFPSSSWLRHLPLLAISSILPRFLPL
jgi:hypothetical protein